MIRIGVVCAVLAMLACEGAPANWQQQVQQKGAEDCECDEGSCEEHGKAQQAAQEPIHKVPVDGAPVAVVANGKFREASTREASDALLTVVIFSDYQCPYCSRGDATVKALAEEYGSNIRFVMKQMPLPMHADAKPAAIAALAAGQQGKYWEMHEKLFANSRALDAQSLEKYATELGLDLARFKQSLADPALARRVEADMAEASALGVRGTPAFFLNGRRIVGAQALTVFKKVASEESARAEALLRSGVSRSQLYTKLTEG